jgi:type IV pilus assembly protein PilA
MIHHIFERGFMRIRKDTSGFSLPELLVAMLILGIVAAIAVPVYLNQKKNAADDATRTDVTNVAESMRQISLQYPSAKNFAFTPSAAKTTGTVFIDLNGNGVANSDEPQQKINVSPETTIRVTNAGVGQFRVFGYNAKGKHYVSTTKSTMYEKSSGGFKKGTCVISTAVCS